MTYVNNLSPKVFLPVFCNMIHFIETGCFIPSTPMTTKNMKYLICMFYVTEIYSYTRIFYYQGSIDKEFILLCLMNEAFKYVDEAYSDTAIVIHTPRLTPDTEKLISLIRMLNMQIAVKRDGETHLLDTEKILYIEAVERGTFVYTEDATYESDLRLYEMEQKLLEQGFFRASKQSILNLKKVKSLKADINRKIRVTLVNGEQILVSRMYADELRRRLGIQ